MQDFLFEKQLTYILNTRFDCCCSNTGRCPTAVGPCHASRDGFVQRRHSKLGRITDRPKSMKKAPDNAIRDRMIA